MEHLSGWGNYPRVEALVLTPQIATDFLDAYLDKSTEECIARGLGRSYGDSSLAAKVIATAGLDNFHRFDEDTGTLTCAAGVSLAEILKVFVPKGWFLPVTPGTKFVTVGGAIASDVHGKNHHLVGSFSDHVTSLKLATVNDGIVICSREERQELFRATCGGMGLTGIVLEATFKLTAIKSVYIDETTIKAENLKELLALFEEYQDATYSVAWIDCLATGDELGRSLLMLGEHSEQGGLQEGKSAKLSIPVNMPSVLLNRYSIQAFNSLYYGRVKNKVSTRLVHYEPYFYPLDGIHHWNRLYGKQGFVQYQFVLPKAAGLSGMSDVLGRIAESKRGSFLAVLKAFGRGNDNYLSFPIEGYTLALDFKMDSGLFELLGELDQVVLGYGGRIYLAKDSRMSESVLKQSYSNWESFSRVRKQCGADRVFHSLQSRRLGL